MNVLYIEGRRDGYGPDQCGETMKVSELIAFLQQFDGNYPVYLKNDNGYTYGRINDRSFEEGFCEDLPGGDDHAVKDPLKLYKVSADGGQSWTEQWFTAQEAKESVEVYGHICELIV